MGFSFTDNEDEADLIIFNTCAVREHAEDILTVSDEQLMQALRFFAERMKLVVEPTGALAFAGALAYAESDPGGKLLHGERVGILISGGNVDLSRYARFLSAVTD
mgnify:CR=1 FL=1